MKYYNVIDYSGVIIGQVEASDAVEAWSEASKRFEKVLDVREIMEEVKHPELIGQIVTFYDSLDKWFVIGETEIPTLSGRVTKIRIRRILPKPEVEGLADPEDLIIS